jgi:hypothetical protein
MCSAGQHSHEMAGVDSIMLVLQPGSHIVRQTRVTVISSRLATFMRPVALTPSCWLSTAVTASWATACRQGALFRAWTSSLAG